MQYDASIDTRSLYIHWPFCPYKCHFCPFVALASQDHLMNRYHTALIKEIKNFAAINSSKATIDTIHFGGGTPSTYPDNLLLDMLGILRTEFCFSPNVEIALEVNPGTVRAEQIPLWLDLGINRLSIGVQGLKDSVLKNLNRHQTTKQVYDLLQFLEGSFENVSVDLIIGLPDVTPAEWKELINQVVTWSIKHVSVYFLTIHEATPLYFKVKTNQCVLPADDEVVALYRWTCAMLAQYGFFQYELSNFAKQGYESRHNSAYWDRNPYRGFGIGACSFDGISRLQNEKNIMRYMHSLENNDSVFVFVEELTHEQVRLEQLMLGLRRPKGVHWEMVIEGCSTIGQEKAMITAQRLEQKGLIEWIDDSSIRLTSQGLAVENEILVQLSHQ
jgi:oxygen-independent coproporphyrinogen III oxidase